MLYIVKKFPLIIFLSFCLISCSTLNSLNPFSSASSAKTDAKPGLPFSLEVADEVNDGERLHILGAVSAAADWNLKDVIVKLTSLAGGNTIGVSYLPLTQAKKKLQTMIKAGEKYSFTISVPSKEITDYQLELLWGEEAKRYLSSVSDETGGVLEIRGSESSRTLRCENGEINEQP